MAKVIIFSGAGISAESGISTFRGSDGLWNNHKIEDICTVGCLDTNREMTIDFYDERRVSLKHNEPNHAHKVVAKLKSKYPNEIAVITQNVDDMFERAGCDDVIHLHGFLTNLRCEKCGSIKNIGYIKQNDNERCEQCNSRMRPDIVFFGEEAPKYKVLQKELDDCKFLVVIGTSGNVINVSYLLTYDMEHIILNNLEYSDAIDDELFTKVLYKGATLAIDEIAQDIEDFLS